jgi:hypothetical protein
LKLQRSERVETAGVVNRRRRIFLLAGCALLALVAVLVWPPEREPEYHGKKLSEWLRLYGTSARATPRPALTTNQQQEAVAAVRALGTNALPCLLRWLAYEPAPWKVKLAARARSIPGGWPPLRWLEESAGARRSTDGMIGFRILGAQAGSAVPALGRLATNSPRVSYRAVDALASIGQAGLPALLEVMRNPGTPDRDRIVWLIVTTSDDASSAMRLRVLLEFLNDKDQRLRAAAATALAFMRLQPEKAVPPLARSLGDTAPRVRAAAAEALLHFARYAQPAVPALLKARADPDASVRVAATNALRMIENMAGAGGNPRSEIQ